MTCAFTRLLPLPCVVLLFFVALTVAWGSLVSAFVGFSASLFLALQWFLLVLRSLGYLPGVSLAIRKAFAFRGFGSAHSVGCGFE